MLQQLLKFWVCCSFCATCTRGGGSSSKVVWLLLWRPDNGHLFREQRGKNVNWTVRKQLSARRCAVNTLSFAHVNDTWVRFWYWYLIAESGLAKTGPVPPPLCTSIQKVATRIWSKSKHMYTVALLPLPPPPPHYPSSFPEPFTFPTTSNLLGNSSFTVPYNTSCLHHVL